MYFNKRETDVGIGNFQKNEPLFCPKAEIKFEKPKMSTVGTEPISAMSEMQLFRSGTLEKTNLYFALFSDIRFFVSPTHCHLPWVRQYPDEEAMPIYWGNRGYARY